jgi:hypothetical protein
VVDLVVGVVAHDAAVVHLVVVDGEEVLLVGAAAEELVVLVSVVPIDGRVALVVDALRRPHAVVPVLRVRL